MSSQPGTTQLGHRLGGGGSRPSSSIRRRLNLAFLAGLLGIIAAASVATYFLHAFQVRRNLGVLFDQARQFEAGGQLNKALERLTMYVNHRPQDGEAWAALARLRNASTPATANRQRVYEAYVQAVRFNPGDAALARKTIDLALTLQRFSDARIHLQELYRKAGTAMPGGSEIAELEDLLGQCDDGESRSSEARAFYEKAIKHDPTRVETYVRLAHLLREAKEPGAADQVIEAMVRANSTSGKAYLSRWNDRQRQGLAGDRKDIDRALELAADDADVLLAAAQAAARKNDLAEARRLIERGLKQTPKNTDFYTLSASIAMRSNHLDEAEAVLRRGIEAIPSNLQIGFSLADLLILRNKLEGPDGAESWIERLRAQHLREGFVIYLEARVLVVRKHYKEAIPRLNTARTLLASEPTFLGRLNLLLAGCYSETGDVESRLAALRQAAGSAEEVTRVTAQARLARQLENAGRFDDALTQYALLAQVQAVATLDAARVSIEAIRRLPRGRQRWSETERWLHAAEQAVPDRTAELALLRADVQAAQGQFADARRTLESALTKNPRDLRLRLTLASVLESQGDWTAASKTLDRAEHELGASVDLTLARIAGLSRQGGDEAKKALLSLSSTFAAAPVAEGPRLLDAAALTWLRLGDRERARQAWRALLQAQPGNLRVLVELCDLAIEAGDHAEARQLVKQLRSVEGEEGAQWRYMEASLDIDLIRRGDAAAVGQVDRLIGEIARGRGDAWGVSVLKGQLAEAQDKLNDAINFYLEAIQQGNAQPALARRTLSLLYRMQRFDQIDSLVATLASRGVDLEDLRMVTVVNALRQGNFDRAVAIARETLPEASTNPFDHITLGQVFQSAGRTQEAGQQFRRARELGPRVPSAWLALVRFLVQTKQLDQARATIEQARAALPAEPAITSLFDQFGFSKDAEAAYRSVLSENPQDPQALLRLIEFLGRQNRIQEALDLWKQARTVLTPDQAADVGVVVAGRPSATAAQRGDVESWLLEALKAQPTSRNLRLKLAFLRIKEGRTAEAEPLYRAVLKEIPDDPEALNNLAELVAFHDGPRDEALNLVNQAIKVAGPVPPLLDTRALIYLQMNQPEHALEDLRKALSASPGRAVFHYHMARAFDQSGNLADARKSFEQAEHLGLKPDAVDWMERELYKQLHQRLIGG